MKRPVFSFRPNLENPSHRKAWEILQNVPEGQKNAFLVQAILQAEEAEYLERVIRQAIREVLENRDAATGDGSKTQAEEIPEQMLAFLSELEET